MGIWMSCEVDLLHLSCGRHASLRPHLLPVALELLELDLGIEKYYSGQSSIGTTE